MRVWDLFLQRGGIGARGFSILFAGFDARAVGSEFRVYSLVHPYVSQITPWVAVLPN